MPLQHTHPAVLKRMARPRVDKVISNFLKYKKMNDNIGIGTDVIVGFPGETDLEFERLFEDLTESPFSYIHVFSYSPRPETVAGKRSDFVDPAIMKCRSRILIDLDKKKRLAFKREQVGLIADVIPDSGGDDKDFVMAVTDNYLKVKLNKSDPIPGQRVGVVLDMDESNILVGTPV